MTDHARHNSSLTNSTLVRPDRSPAAQAASLPNTIGECTTMIKQQVIPGTESEEHTEIHEAAQELRAAKLDQKRAGDRVSKAMHVLVARMIAAKQKFYGFDAGAGRFVIELEVPQPTVKLSYQEQS